MMGAKRGEINRGWIFPLFTVFTCSFVCSRVKLSSCSFFFLISSSFFILSIIMASCSCSVFGEKDKIYFEKYTSSTTSESILLKFTSIKKSFLFLALLCLSIWKKGWSVNQMCTSEIKGHLAKPMAWQVFYVYHTL